VSRWRLVILTCAALLARCPADLAARQEKVRSSPDAAALIRAGSYQQAESTARTSLEAVRAATHDDPLQVAAASDVLVEALILNGRGASVETLELASRALRAKESKLGTDDPDLVPSLLNLADSLVDAGEFDRAVAVSARAVGLRDRGAGAATPSLELARALDHYGAALSSRRRHDDALKVFARSLSIKEHVLAPTDPDIARTLEGLTVVLQRQAAYAQSGAAVRRAASIRQAADASHPAYATTLNLLAQQLWFEGDLLGSKDTSERAVALAESALRPDHPTLALALRYLANTLIDLGDFAGGLARCRRALDIAQRAYGPSHFISADYLNDLGYAELAHGDYQSARRLLQQALVVTEARYGAWHEYVAGTLNGLARADTRLGNYASATQELSRVAAIHTRIAGANHPYVAMALADQANVYVEQGLHGRAIPLLERALGIRERALGRDHRDVARTLADLGAALMQAGQPTRAQQLASRALRIWERLDAPEAPAYAAILSLYAKLQLGRGDIAAARDYYDEALAIRAKVFGASHPLYAEAQSGLALALASAGDAAGAVRAAASAESVGRDHLSLMLRSLPEREALNYAAARPRGLDLLLSLAPSTPDAAPIALDDLIRTRALVLDEIAARRSAPHEGEVAGPRAELSAAQQRLANLIVRGPGVMSPVQYQAVVESARRDSENAEQALAAASLQFRAARSRAQIGLADVDAALPADGALVAFARYQRTVLSAAAPRNVPSYVALVRRRNQPAAIVPLGSAAAIDALVSQWRADILARASRPSGVALRRRVWDPLTTHLAGVTRVFVVPDGALGLVPFAALPVGQRSYLLETGPMIHYLSAERDLVPSPQAPLAGRGLLALGGPSYDDATLFRSRSKSTRSSARAATSPTRGATRESCGAFEAASFQPLDGTLREVRDLKRIWSANPATESESARVLVGHDASETTFKREAPGSRVLHVATHGFFLNDTCPGAPAGTRGVGGVAKSGGPAPVANPLRLSGLALAGANRRASAGPEEDEGILTAEEVASLNLEGVEWAVLSACDTGVGEIKAGEGILGLRRSFQIAGARTVIMSLWSVDDDAARDWMRAVYDARFGRKRSTVDAVQSANLAVLRARRARGQSTEPFYWAAFAAVGDWR
jgi:CHAT domain-containing protein/tetratricopeptide (TPR) repeat protein